ncbi:MAG: ribosome-associated translation inhibitor RaiA [Thermodesulfobacteriota bacterium]
MQIMVTFRHMETDEGVKDYVKGKVKRLQKYIENPREAHVVLSVEKFRNIAEITMIGDGAPLNSQGKNSDLYAAIDQMVDKIERQIRERRGKERRKRSNPTPSNMSLQSGEDGLVDKGEEEIFSIVQRRRTLAKPMSLEEAVAQLNLSKEDFLVFINSDSEQVNVLYRSKDGGVEWVEPHPK